MIGKDLNEKILVDYNDVFADINNVLLFDGERRIKAEELLNSRVQSQYKSSDDKLHEEERDVSKIWKKNNVKMALYGIENQNKVHNKMPMRIFGYEGASYREQLNEKNNYPVISLVLYFGTKYRWNAKRHLKEIIEIPEYLEDYVNDLKINVCEVAWLPQETIDKFTSDFKVVANFFVNKRKNKDYIPEDKTEIEHVDAVLKLLSTMTGDKRYEEILADNKEGKVRSMCEVADRLERRGIERGRQESKVIIEEKDREIAQKDEQLSEKSKELLKAQKEIARLKAQLAAI